MRSSACRSHLGEGEWYRRLSPDACKLPVASYRALHRERESVHVSYIGGDSPIVGCELGRAAQFLSILACCAAFSTHWRFSRSRQASRAKPGGPSSALRCTGSLGSDEDRGEQSRQAHATMYYSHTPVGWLQRGLRCGSSPAPAADGACFAVASGGCNGAWSTGAADIALDAQRGRISGVPPSMHPPSAAPAEWCFQSRIARLASRQIRTSYRLQSCIRHIIGILLLSLLAASPARAGDRDCAAIALQACS
jgi:hypothetical protein